MSENVGRKPQDYRESAAPHSTLFREYDIRGTLEETLFENDAYLIGRAFGARLRAEAGAGRVCLGYDGRESSPMLKAALARGLMEEGHTVLDVGLGPTPMLYYAAVTENAAGGIMITGSHNPPDQNGFKFMIGKKPFYGEDIRKLERAIAMLPPKGDARGSIEPLAIKDKYIKTLIEAFKPERELAVAWDAGNGAAGEIMAALCARLPGRHIALNEKIDGTFPAHHPDPTVPENLAQLIETVRREQCDLGIAFDGDGDRIGVVDDKGEILWGDQLLALYAAPVLQRHPGATVIADVKASQVLFDEIARLGGAPLMWKTGHSHIKAKMAETGAPLAGEMSGHIFFADEYFGYDDALYAAVRLLSLLAAQEKPLSALRAALPTRQSTPEIRFPCAEARKFAVIDEVRARLAAARADFSEVDGVRVTTPEGWWLLRASNTQAMLVARCEAADASGLEALKANLQTQLAQSGVQLPQNSAAH